MKQKILSLIIVLSVVATFTSCKKDDDAGSLGGTQSAIGSVNNTFQLSGIPSGISGVSAKVTDFSNGISKVTYTGTVTNQTYLNLLKTSKDVTVSGNTVSCNCNCKITSEGMETVFDEGTLTLVKNDAKVGDTWSLNHGGSTIKREVTEVSNEDTYYWGGMYIKTIKVKESGRNVPGYAGTEFIYNHKFGIVGVKLLFEDGTSKTIGVSSANQN